jgi:ribulose-5-phosphate 4-epimerase/fuculose-1-phosphate aldolase
MSDVVDRSHAQAAAKKRISVYQPKQEGLTFPEISEFTSMPEERLYRKRHLVAACRAFALHNLDYGFAGHLTVRDPEHPELYWTNPMCVHFSQVKMSNLILADHKGKVVEGTHAINQAGFVLHSAVHEAHPDIVAMCHAHTVYGTAWAATGRKLDPITQDAAVFYEDHVVIDDEAGQVAVEEGAGYSVASWFKDVKAAIHKNHGLLTASRHSIDDAAFWFIALERVCQQQLLVEASGIKPTLVPPERARYSREHVGSPFIGWLHFQTIYDQLVATQSDMFD